MEWINVYEQLPPTGRWVLTYSSAYNAIHTAAFDGNRWHFGNTDNDPVGLLEGDITHWMPLPANPKAVQKHISKSA